MWSLSSNSSPIPGATSAVNDNGSSGIDSAFAIREGCLETGANIATASSKLSIG